MSDSNGSPTVVVRSFVRSARMLVAATAISAAHAQECEPEFHALAGGMSGGLTIPSVLTSAIFDSDGDGAASAPPMLHVGGNFTHAGELLVNALAAWDGARWHDVGPLTGPVGVGGGRTHTSVHALVVHDADGDGPQPRSLFVGGDFTTAGSIAASLVARWDGAAWSALDEGLDWDEFAAWARAFGVFDEDGDGPRPPALFVGGDFMFAGALHVSFIARWDGESWSAVGGGVNGPVYAFATFDEGDGPALYAAGNFTRAGGEGGMGADSVAAPFVARWDGSRWSSVGGGTNATVRALSVFDGGREAALYAGGYFDAAGGSEARGIARWDGVAWADVRGGIGSTQLFPGVEALLARDDGTAPELFVAGQFETAGAVDASNLARWNGFGWNALDGGIGPGDTAAIGRTLASYRHDLYIGGDFIETGSGPARYIARWIDCITSCTADLFPVGAPNGIVGRGDRALLIWAFGDCPAPCPADIHPPAAPDGRVDVHDLGELAAQWGRCP